MGNKVENHIRLLGHKVYTKGNTIYDSTGKTVYQDNGLYYVKNSEGTRLYFTNNGKFRKVKPEEKGFWSSVEDAFKSFASKAGQANPQGQNAFIPSGSLKIVELSLVSSGIPVKTSNNTYRTYSKKDLDKARKLLGIMGATAVAAPAIALGTITATPYVVKGLNIAGQAMTPSTWIGGAARAVGGLAPGWLLNGADLATSLYYGNKAKESIDKEGLNWETGFDAAMAMVPVTRSTEAIDAVGNSLRGIISKDKSVVDNFRNARKVVRGRGQLATGTSRLATGTSRFISSMNRALTKGRNYLRSKNPWSKRYSIDRINSILFKNTEPDYLKHFKREHSTQLSRDVAEAMAMRGLAENNIYHTKLLQELGEGNIRYYPEAGTYMNDGAFARYYRIIPKEDRWKYPKPITLSKEEGRIREVFPEYYVYARQRGLPVDDENTFAEFLNRMSTSTRGSTLKNKELAEEYLTTAGNAPSGKPGGDRLYTNSGLYTSNSEEIADRFSKNITGVSSNPYGATAKLYHQFDIDNTLPISRRLQQLRDQINDVTVSSPKDNTLRAFGEEFNLGVPDYNSNPEIHAVEGPYMGRESKERVYIGHKPKDKVVDVKGDIKISSDVNDRKHRWSPGEVRDEEGLFIPSYASYTKENIKKYADRIIENNPQWTKEFKEDLQRRIVRIANIHRRKMLGRTLQVTSPLLAGLIGGSIAYYDYNTEQIDKSNREFYSKLEYYRNNGYKQDLSELKYMLGMDDNAQTEDVIREAEKIYKEMSAELKEK